MSSLASQTPAASEHGLQPLALTNKDVPAITPMSVGTPSNDNILTWKPSLLVQRRRRLTRRAARH